jgi:RimJ/RimL family protein N-acetyltransferase
MNMHAREEEGIPDKTLEAFARSFFKEASAYGFQQLDYLRFVNQLLDISMNDTQPPAAVAPIRAGADALREPVPNGLPISGRRVSILPLQTEEDRETVKGWLHDRHGRHFLLSPTTSLDVDFDELVSSASNYFGLIALPDGTLIGSVAFLDYDPVQHKAELRKLIGEPGMRAKGLAKESTRLWIRYGIEVLGLRKIYLNTLDTNIRNIRLNEELGFKFEGILHNEVFFDGKYHDVLRMGIWTD